MAKVTFGLRRLSDALDMLTPKKFKKKYFRLGDEEEDMLVSRPAARPSQVLSVSEEPEVERAKECPLREEESLLDTDPKV